MLEMIETHFVEILFTFFTAVFSFIGLALKKMYFTYMDNITKKDVVKETVAYVEQTCRSKDLSCSEKFDRAKVKAKEWLKEKKISISDTELEVLIESAVNASKKKE